MELLVYLSAMSARAGQTIDVMVSGSGRCELSIAPFFAAGDLLHRASFAAREQPMPICGFAEGFGWPPSHTFEISPDWPSGPYVVRVRRDENEFYCFFIVKAQPENLKTNVVVVNTNTWNAYDVFGGASVYRYLSESETRWGSPASPKGSKRVCFMRPSPLISENIAYAIWYLSKAANQSTAIADGRYKVDLPSDPQVPGHFVFAEMLAWSWLAANGIAFDLLTDFDLHRARISPRYRNIVLVAHPEYWSEEMFYNLCRAMEKGANLISLSGNQIHRRVEFKGGLGNPAIQKNYKPGSNGHNTYLWTPHKPGTRLASVQASGLLKATPGQVVGSYYNTMGYNTYAPYKLRTLSHWAFDGVKPEPGNLIGTRNYKGAGACGYEVDSSILGIDPVIAEGDNGLEGGKGHIMSHKVGASNVFSVGSVAFTASLHIDPGIARMTQNVFQKFGGFDKALPGSG